MTDWKKIISEWGTPAMSVYATELVCSKCDKYMGAVIFAKEESSNNFTQSDAELLCQNCFEELKKAVNDRKTPMKEGLLMQFGFTITKKIIDINWGKLQTISQKTITTLANARRGTVHRSGTA